jgi:hypothetical protein
MNKTILCMLALIAALSFTSCDDDETYADQVKHERSTVNSFVRKGVTLLEETTGDTLLHVAPVKVISEETFAAQDSTTDVSQNEYVLFKSTGIYMQIIRKGAGEKLADGQSTTALIRYLEYNIGSDSIQTRNNNLYYVATPDEMRVTNSSGTFTGSFVTGQMRTHYGASVPESWLLPFSYINLCRYSAADAETAKIRLIVPHTYGQDNAKQRVYACFYELTYMRGRQ